MAPAISIAPSSDTPSSSRELRRGTGRRGETAVEGDMADDYAIRQWTRRACGRFLRIVARRQKSRYSGFMIRPRDFVLSRASSTALLGGLLLLRPARR